MERHKCAECGFLTVDGTVDEVGEEMRGNWPHVSGDAQQCLIPCCFEEVFSLRNEVGRAYGGKGFRGSNFVPLTVITTQRECGHFTKWRPHKSPAEHRQMIHDQNLREEVNRQKERELQFQKEREERSYQFQEKQLAWEKEEKRSSRWWAVWNTCLSVILAGFITLIIQILKEPAATPPLVAPQVIEFKPIINNSPLPEKSVK